MKKLIVCISLFLFGFSKQVLAQKGDLSKQIFTLVNEARTQPQIFLKKYENQILSLNSKFISKLKTAQKIEPMIWDTGLVSMSKKIAEKKDLNPNYQGKSKICGMSSGNNYGTLSTDPLYYVCDNYLNILNQNYIYIGLYFSKGNTAFAFYLGRTCDPKRIKYHFDGKVDSSKVDFSKINTAKNCKFITSEVERRMILEVNFVRYYPQIFSQILCAYMSKESDHGNGLSLEEYEAFIELKEELDTMKPLSILQPFECVYKAAVLHGNDCKKRGYFSHTGSDNSFPNERILKQCKTLKFGSENGAGNWSKDPRIPLIDLLLDDGISSRGHRYNIINPAWTYIGCYRYEDVKYKFYWVQNFAY